jgi:polysaccharide deacetylase family protein (PEP-CTERM system associated)
MTVDVEDYFHASALARAAPRSRWDQLEYRAESNTRVLLEMFAARGIRATFFVLGWVAERSPKLIREIDAAGHEVACHGYSHELVYRQTREVFHDETRRAKRLLEDIVGREVCGYRAASYSITAQSLWALDVIAELGFRYDSSIFPVRHDVYGIPGAPRDPGWITAPSGATLVEFPLSTARIFGAQLPVAGGGYFRLLPYWLTRAGLRQINAEGKPFIFYLHPWEIDAQQPRLPVGLKSRLRHYTNLSVCKQRLADLITRFKFARVVDVLGTLGLMQEAPRASAGKQAVAS